AGAFTFLSQYPIVDVPHLAWSSGVLLVTGAILLARLQARLARTWRLTPLRERALLVALLVVPALAALPILVDIRLGYFFRDRPIVGQPLVRRPLVPFDSETFARDLWANVDARDELRAVVDAVHARTDPGEPIFVYPASPLVYILADRPN